MGEILKLAADFGALGVALAWTGVLIARERWLLQRMEEREHRYQAERHELMRLIAKHLSETKVDDAFSRIKRPK